ncbi:MAG: TolC family protein [Luteimonas sp.]
MGFSILLRHPAGAGILPTRGKRRNHYDRPKKCSASRALMLGATLGWSLLLTPVSYADEPVPGATIASVRDWLVAHNPQLRALQADADAAGARIQPAGALPDPMASVVLREIDPDQPSLLPGNVGSTTYLLKQKFPLWGKRELTRDVARYEAQARQLDRDATAMELLAQADEAYVRYWHAREAITVIDRLIGLLDRVEEIAGVRYALGMAAQQDSIRAQVARTQVQRERIERLAAGREATTALNAVLGRRADALFAEPTSPPRLAVASMTLEDALQRLERGAHPALQASTAMSAAASSNVDLQRRNRFPDISLGVGSMQRGNRLDSYEVMLEVEIPFQQRARRERERESRSLQDAALARVDAARSELEGRLGSAWARWFGAREQRQLIEKTLLPQSDANFNSAMASYQVGEVDFGTLLDALREWQGADLARLDATRDELLGAAAVRAIDGATR